MAGMFVNLRKKPGLVTAYYIIDLKWCHKRIALMVKMYVRFFMASIASVHSV